MKVLLTEAQIRFITEAEQINILKNSLNESVNFNDLVKTIKQALAVGVTATAIIASINSLNISDKTKQELTDIVTEEPVYPQRDTVRGEKIAAIKEYMAYAAKNQKFNPEHIKLSPEVMIDVCDTTGFDLPLLLAQAHLESCFGLTNRAQKTNSVFSVGSYDNGKNVCTYETQDESVEPYVKLMQNNYIRDRKIEDMLKPNMFTDHLQQRYARDANYESKVKNIRQRIIRMYPILQNT